MPDSINRVYIEATSRCNFDCAMCFRNSCFNEEFMDMPFEIFEQSLASIPNTCTSIVFAGMGEPMFHPRIFDMLKACKEKDFQVEIVTNGSLLTEEAIKKILHINIDKLWISLDSFENTLPLIEKKIEYKEKERCSGHPNSSEIIQNIKNLNTLRQAASFYSKFNLELGIAFVVNEANIAQLEHLPYFIKKYYVDYVNISHMKPQDNKNAQNNLYSKTLNRKLASDKVKQTIINIPYMDFDRKDVSHAFETLFAKMNFIPHVGNIPVPRRTQYCRFIEEGMIFIRADGNVSPCMELLHNGKTALAETDRIIHHHSFGNIGENTLEEIWLLEEYKDFRQRVRDFSFSPCTYCGHCGDTEANLEDCMGNQKPCCGACLWAEGFLSCP